MKLAAARHQTVKGRFAPLRRIAATLLLCAAPATGQCQWTPGVAFDLTGSTIAGSRVEAMTELPNGDIIAGGIFDRIGGVAATNIARWNGAGWLPVGAFGGAVGTMAVLPSGDICIGTYGGIRRWDGTSWTTIGNLQTLGSPGGDVFAMAAHPSGYLLVAGYFTQVNGVTVQGLARWTPGTASWSAVGNFSSPYIAAQHDIVVETNGDVIVLGYGSPTATMNRFDGVWHAMPAPPLASTSNMSYSPNHRMHLVRTPQGRLLATGSLPQGGWGVCEWDGVSWSAPIPCSLASFVSSAIQATTGTLFVGGQFAGVNSVASTGIARRACPPGFATASLYGAGCYNSIATAYEHFGTGAAFDMSQSTVRLDFDGQAFHATTLSGLPQFAVPTSPALPLTDDSLSSPIALPFTLPYPGGSTNQIVVGSNGFVYLQPATDASAFYGNVSGLRNGAPRLAPMWADQDPGVGTGGGSVHVETIGQAVIVTWWNVEEYSHPALISTFQLALFDGGDVEYRYLGCAASFPALTGWSPGGGARDPVSSNVSAWAGLVCRPDSLPLLHGAQNRPMLGTTVVMHTSNVPTNSPLGATVIGFVQYNPGLDLGHLGMPSCPQFTSAEVAVLAVPVAEQMWYSWSLPLDLSFLGAHINTQGVAMTAGLNALGFITSNGLDLRLGDV